MDFFPTGNGILESQAFPPLSVGGVIKTAAVVAVIFWIFKRIK